MRSSSCGLTFSRPSAAAIGGVRDQLEAIAAHGALEAIAHDAGKGVARERRLQRLVLRTAQLLDENAGEHAAVDLEGGQPYRVQEIVRRAELVRVQLAAFIA